MALKESQYSSAVDALASHLIDEACQPLHGDDVIDASGIVVIGVEPIATRILPMGL